ncbi:sulfotransferase [uncultured Amaricoccus sp.]|uniref:sulfotransferase n=1 Tax=uncultured Amaricoccus sp. TaxID=339341 RepID=UPI002620C94C|nr:sulfotransferase [uncultured Amaricoccus sp.]
MTDLVYISGSGRSGSTLLERLLHADGRVFAAGELHVLWRLPPERITCSCGARFADCGTWQAILAASGLGDRLGELAALEARVSRSGFLRRRGMRPERVLGEAEVMCFLEAQLALVAAIGAVTGKRVVVDSSKAGPRAFLLSCLDGPLFIHLRRDPGDVIASWRSRKFDRGLGADMQRLSAARAAEDWLKAEYFARAVGARRPVAFVDYAGFCGAPRATLRAIEGRIGSRFDGVAWTGPAEFAPGAGYHSLNGNPDRFSQGPIDITHRAPDRAALSRGDRLAARVLGGLAGAMFPARGAAAVSER